MTKQPLWPPKPKELERAGAGSHARGAPCTRFNSGMFRSRVA